MSLAHIELHSSLPRDSNRSWTCEASEPSLMLRCDARTRVTTLSSSSGPIQHWTNPLDALTWMSAHFDSNGSSRWIGYLSYDLGFIFEDTNSRAPSPPSTSPSPGTPGEGRGGGKAPEGAQLSAIVPNLNLPLFLFTFHQLDKPTETKPPPHELHPAPLQSSFTREQYLQTVQRCIDYIAAGDIFQVNLSQCFTAGLASQPREIWSRLKHNSPAAYGAFLDYGDHALLSNSPELFLKVDCPPGASRRRIVTSPIKGTRPRGPGMKDELAASAKDDAELNMIIDLERNDLGRVCEIGSVRVIEPRKIEVHPTVYHGVATIAGELREDVTFIDLLRATFPGGSVTGAPKIRAMQIIDELETVRRGPYCGAIGYLASDGSMEFNVAIRTMIIKDGAVHIPVGGGVVADSDPMAEYEETLVKAKALFAALGISAGEIAAATK